MHIYNICNTVLTVRGLRIRPESGAAVGGSNASAGVRIEGPAVAYQCTTKFLQITGARETVTGVHTRSEENVGRTKTAERDSGQRYPRIPLAKGTRPTASPPAADTAAKTAYALANEAIGRDDSEAARTDVRNRLSTW